MKNAEASFNEIYRQYKLSAKQRNRSFKISKLDFKRLTSSICYYCGSMPKTKRNHHKTKYKAVYTYNGLDRVDNNKGYLKDNVVPCCETCNKMKFKLKQLDFFKHIQKIFTQGKKYGIYQKNKPRKK